MVVDTPRNPGPSWGYRVIDWLDAHLLPPLRDALVFIGSSVAYLGMHKQRQASREYLQALLGSPPPLADRLRHFDAITHSLLAKLRAGQRVDTKVEWADEANKQTGAIVYSDEPILLGTFHVGASDLLGFHVRTTGRRVSMIRERVANSSDIERLLAQSGDMVEVIWVNQEADIVFALRDALEAGKTLAMQCDRVAHASKTEGFEFLGATRAFPVTIYRLAALYHRPVQFFVALPRGKARDDFAVYASPLYRPTGNRNTDQLSSHKHFQAVLTWLENLLRAHPFQWFNFLPLNPVWTADTNATCQRAVKKPR
ncbi:hypothetical protein [Cerasicoccus arenae]|uniref:Lipid A biosynthesis lauroyl acyltransferase n=1 Tax=Cerasicoccus arenae TaxID=424488 RepID=A0A8J3D8Z0_9BACT|nr:hypothetical protein [Cerasicoccus arenae]MBK1858319.1 hypothetical protein [Cerasicoccus arenae]GHB90747.1 hypothetical protein GCM10007047_01950 [Cerasicoccus arenae]